MAIPSKIRFHGALYVRAIAEENPDQMTKGFLADLKSAIEGVFDKYGVPKPPELLRTSPHDLTRFALQFFNRWDASQKRPLRSIPMTNPN